MTVTSTPRAVRNSNPCNIIKGDPWQGALAPEMMTPEQMAEDRFVVFSSPRWGFRAAAVTLIAYYDKYHIETVETVVKRWAPPTENDTNSYIDKVCGYTTFGPEEVLNLHDYATLSRLIKAMSIVECGGWMFNDMDLDLGLRGAGVEPPAAPFVASRGMPTKIISGAAAGSAGVIQTLHDTRDQLSEFSYMAWAAKIMLGLTVLIIAWQVYEHHADWHRNSR